jgi:hypothetical protein
MISNEQAQQGNSPRVALALFYAERAIGLLTKSEVRNKIAPEESGHDNCPSP